MALRLFAIALAIFVSQASHAQSASARQDSKPEYDIVAAGDVMLGRMVAKEIQVDRINPWQKLEKSWPTSAIRVANLETVVTDDPLPCLPHSSLCLRMPSSYLSLVKEAGFTHLSLTNNHEADLGLEGLQQTRQFVRSSQLRSIDRHLQFEEIDGLRIATLGINLIPDALGQQDKIPSISIAQQIRLAKSLADRLIISIHWGQEYQSWASQQQRELAEWLVEQGADLILGHHPHVIQTAECIKHAAVWYSLGNHVFDQKYEATQTGALAACRFYRDKEGITCAPYFSSRSSTSAVLERLARAKDQESLQCESQHDASQKSRRYLSAKPIATTRMEDKIASVELYLATDRKQQQALSQAMPLRSIQAIDLGLHVPTWLMLLELASPFDQSMGLRPHIYSLREGRLHAEWRGSALAFPILDVLVQTDAAGRDFLCALHEARAHLSQSREPNGAPFTLAYRWQRFGFQADHSAALQQQCDHAFQFKQEQ